MNPHSESEPNPPVERLTVLGSLPTDLPPVEPPSAGFIVQLFVIPAVIVAVVIAVWLLFGKLAGGERDVMWYVQTLKSSDANFRTAYELGSLIKNDPQIAADGRLLGELTELLDHDLDAKAADRLLEFLAASLGVFTTLDATTADGKAAYPLRVLSKALEEGRPTSVRKAAALSIAAHAGRMNGALDDSKTVAALAAAKSAESSEVRTLAVFALGFFGGEDAPKALTACLNDPDWGVRYNAAAALARRGALAPKGFLKEMLRPQDLARTLADLPAAERDGKAEAIQILALESLRTGVRTGRQDLAKSVQPELEALSRSGMVSVRSLAAELLKDLQNPPADPKLPSDAVTVGRAAEVAPNPLSEKK